MSENKNITKLKPPKFKDGPQVLKVLNIVIEEKKSFYNCLMDNGEKELISISKFK